MAKKKKAKAPKPTGEKPSTIAQRRKKRRKSVKVTKVTRETRETRSNPAATISRLSEIGAVVLPAFAGFAGTKILQRVIYSIIQRKFPRFGKYAHAASGLAAFAGVTMFAHKIKPIERWADEVAIGSGIAAAHGLVACLPPKYNWLLTDCKPSDVAPSVSAPQTAGQIATAAATAGDEYSYLEDALDEMEGGSKRARTVPAPRANTRPVASAMAVAAGNDGGGVDPDLMAELGDDENVDDLYGGSLSN